MDKLDRINEKKFIRKNLVKWWDVNLTDAVLIDTNEAGESDEYDETLMAEGEEVASEPAEEISQETLDTANEIYARLMAEAAADEAAKQAEIEAAKLANS